MAGNLLESPDITCAANGKFVKIGEIHRGFQLIVPVSTWTSPPDAMCREHGNWIVR